MSLSKALRFVACAAAIALAGCPQMFVYVPEGAESLLPSQNPETSTPGVAGCPHFETVSVLGGDPGAISSEAAIYRTDQLVSITCCTEGATLYYTVDGTDPNPYGTGVFVFDAEHPIQTRGDGSTLVVTAIALAPQMYPSEIARVSISVDFSRASTPSISPPSGTLTEDFQITMSSQDAGADIWYTFSTSEPVADPVPGTSPRYTGPIAVSGNGTQAWIKAVATVAQLKDSLVSHAEYTIQYPTAAPVVFTPPQGTYSSDQTVVLSCSTPGSEIWFTTDGSDPEPGVDGPYDYTPISVAGHGTDLWIKAIATADQMLDGPLSAGHYIIDYFHAAPPTFDPPEGTYDTDIAVTLQCTTPDASIWYTTDGTDPVPYADVLYVASIPVAGDGTDRWIKAIATAPGFADSTVSQAHYLIDYPPPPPAPTIVYVGAASSHEMLVDWSDSPGATTYELWRDGSPVTLTAATNYLDFGLTPATGYTYTVRAGGPGGWSPGSVPAWGMTLMAPPQNVAATDGIWSQKVRITWDAVPGATDYQVLQDDVPVGTSGGLLRFDHVTTGVGYYRVRTCEPDGGELSAWDAGSTGTLPPVYLQSMSGPMWAVPDVMDQAMGGYWEQQYYEEYMGHPWDLLLGDRVIFMDGWWDNSIALRQFLDTYRPEVETWVADGGRLFINCSPRSTIPGMDLVFSCSLSLTGGDTNVWAEQPGHPIFWPPLYDVVENFSGSPCATAVLSADPLLMSASWTVLAELAFSPVGSGWVLLGTLEPPHMFSLYEEARRLYVNILYYLRTRPLPP